MTWSDPIVDEVRLARDAYAAQFDYDLRAIVRDLKTKEKCGGRPVVSCVDGGESEHDSVRSDEAAIGRAGADTDRTPADGSAPSGG